MSAELIDALWRVSVVVSLLLLVLLALRGPLRRRLGPEAVHLLWVSVPLSMLAVLLPGNPAVLALAELPAVELLAAPIRGDATASAPGAGHGIARALVVVWLAGLVVFAGLVVAGQHRFLGRLGQRRRGRGPVMLCSRGDALPALVSPWAPRLLLPHDFRSRYGARQRRLMLAHEAVHLRRGDLWWRLLAVLVQGLLWFNPLVHVAAARFRADQELACDAVVMRRLPGRRRSYADAILGVPNAPPGGLLACHWGRFHPIKERLDMLSRSRNEGARRRFVQAGVLAGALAVAAVAWAVQPGAGAGSEDASVGGASYAALSAPRYPVEAVEQRMEGRVVLRVEVAEDGTASAVAIQRSSGHPVLDASAREAVASWTFNPAREDGRAVPASVLVPVDFALDADAAGSGEEPGALQPLTRRAGG